MDDLQSRREVETFIVVYGAPRTGTSLCMDIAQAAGYCAGRCHRQPLDKRAGRNEHPLFGKLPGNVEHAWRVIKEEGMSCAKVIGFYDWIPLLAEKFDVKILAPDRIRANRRKSICSRNVAGQVLRRADVPPFTQEELDKKTAEMCNHRLFLQDKVLLEREGILPRHPHLRVCFEKLIDKDVGEFGRIARFLHCDMAKLMDCIDKRRVRFPA